VFSCDYNGWADVPEEEREGMDAFETARVVPRALLPAPRPVRASIPRAHGFPQRRAA
jgi:hypothetical protein